MFDSPFEYCPRCRAYVVLDQTQGNARENIPAHRRRSAPSSAFALVWNFMSRTESQRRGGKPGHHVRLQKLQTEESASC